ncbi:TonB-dependent receptor [Novosphingobium nitrogenifigens DSM 19370]|uniref:TonB-dependent receptor n=1 Tax=Novosphingobium nitrogenifigens DSM 19370 TaxID=983920 RepID=F1Z866_9SPHN|nr:TonB-dependent receptor [Novosphingobium nitrogenifigens]EGD59159.1 TonB-dependent receptor [Novosphingobium nitrogenifigens DSM 19370]
MRKLLSGLLAGTGIIMAAPALADEASAPDATGAASGDAEPILVTARQRVEDAQTVPTSLSVVNALSLQRSYTVNIQQLTTLVPSLNYSSANPRNTAFTIRGLGSSVVAVSQANDGLENGVGFYVDGVYHARPATAAFDFTDIDRIEVLRGPQGTLFGKNTTAGAINIVSRLPEFKPSATQELSYGEKNFLQVKATATAPLIGDTVAWRLSGQITRRDGVIHNVRTAQDLNGINTQAVRGQLLIQPDATLRIRVIADFTNFDANCCAQVYLRVGTSLRAASKQYAALAAAAHYSPPSTNPYDRLTDIDASVGAKTNEGGVSINTDWNFGPATLTSISAWRFWNWDASNDRDYTGLQIQTTQHIPSRQDQFSQELRVASNGEHRIGYVAGLYYFRQKLTGHPISIYGSYGAPWLLGATTGASATPVPSNLLDGYGQSGDTRFVTDSYAAFAEVNWRIVPGLVATGGVRYTKEVKDGDYSTTVFGGLATTNAALIAAKLSVLRPQSYTAHDNNGSVSGRANLAWQITQRIMAYVSWARGYKSGGINMSGLPLDSSNNPVLSTAVIRPERHDSWEAGVKTRLFAEHLMLNADVFQTKVHNFQSTIVDSSQTVALRGYLANIPEVTVRGVEADAAFHLGQFTLTGALSYDHGVYTSYPAGPCPLEVQTSSTTACNLTGKPLVGLPKWSETLGLDWALPIKIGATRSGAIALHADTNWRTSYNGDPSLSQYTWIDGYNLTNASIGWRSSKGWEIAVFARNLFNSNYIQNLTVQAGNSGLILGTPSDPRVIGVTFRARE